MGSSQTRARTRVPCIGRQILNHCATREAPGYNFKHKFIQTQIITENEIWVFVYIAKDNKIILFNSNFYSALAMCFKWPKLGLHIALQQYRLYKGWFSCIMIVREMHYMTVRAESNVSRQVQTWWCYCGFSLSLSACLSVSQTLYSCSPSSGIYFLKNLEDNTILSEVMYPIFSQWKPIIMKIQKKRIWRHKGFSITGITRWEGSPEVIKYSLLFPQVTLRIIEVGWLAQAHPAYKWHSRFPVQCSFFYSWFLVRVGFKSLVLRVILSWKLREWNLCLPVVIYPSKKVFP